MNGLQGPVNNSVVNQLVTGPTEEAKTVSGCRGDGGMVTMNGDEVLRETCTH